MNRTAEPQPPSERAVVNLCRARALLLNIRNEEMHARHPELREVARLCMAIISEEEHT